MAALSQRVAPFLSRINLLPDFVLPSVPLFHFSTLDTPMNPGNGDQNPVESRKLEEQQVLYQLSALLPIRYDSNRDMSSIVKVKTGVVDDFLSSERNLNDSSTVAEFLLPEEKFRGIFLQKLKGKTAIERALTSVGADLSADVVAKVVNRGNLGGGAMVTFFDWAIKQPGVPKEIDSYHVILKALGRRKFFAHMMEILRDLKTQKINPNSDTLFIVMDSFIRASQVSKAIQMFGQLKDFGFMCDTTSLNVMLGSLCRRSHVGTANSLLNKMKSKVPFDNETYNIVIGGWCKFGRISEVERILKDMVEEGIVPDKSTFRHLMEGLGRDRRIDDSIEIFRNLRKSEDSAIDTCIYNAMISNFISIGDFDECLKYYGELLSSNCDPNVDTYVLIISGFLKARRVADAIEMFDDMLGRGIIPTTGTVTSFIEPLCSYGPPHAALMFYKKAREVGCKISMTAYKLLLARLSKLGKCGMLLNIWNEMQQDGYSSDKEVYEHIINGFCNVGQLENAILVMEECFQNGFCPGRIICSKLNNKLLNSNKVETAYKLLFKIRNARCDENARRYWRAKGWHF